MALTAQSGKTVVRGFLVEKDKLNVSDSVCHQVKF